MRYSAWYAGLIGLALFVIMSAGSAQAQATRTWVSGVGDDANPCSRTAPCKTFAGAISKTATGGEINCIDPGGFGGVTITKAIAIICDNTEAGVLVSGTNGIIINAPAGAFVTLKGLDIEGLGTGLNGINYLAGGGLHVHKVQIRHFTLAGINFAPSANANELFVADTYITENGNSAANGGILIRPTSTGTATFSINRTQIENNSTGLRIDTTAPGGVVKGVLRNSMVAGNNNNGVSMISAASAATLMVDNVSVSGNNNGLAVQGGATTMLVNQTSVTANVNGLVTNAGTTMSSYKNNAVNGNTADGAFTGTITPQ